MIPELGQFTLALALAIALVQASRPALARANSASRSALDRRPALAVRL